MLTRKYARKVNQFIVDKSYTPERAAIPKSQSDNYSINPDEGNMNLGYEFDSDGNMHIVKRHAPQYFGEYGAGI